MLNALETILRQISWLPGMGWLETYANQLNLRQSAFGQRSGNVKSRATQYKNIATDPLGKKRRKVDNATKDAAGGPAGNEAAENSGQGAARDNGGGDQQTRQRKGKKLSTSPAMATGSGVAPSYRAERAAARASFAMFLFLVIMVSVVWVLFMTDPRNVPWRHSMSWWRIGLQILLVIAIPIFTHRIVRLWLEGNQSKYPDIDYAWNHGMHALHNVGVHIDSVPLFLLIGSGDDEHEVALMSASRLDFRTSAAPEGPAALHWYVTPSAIYLFATDVGWTSAMAALASQASESGSPRALLNLPSDAITFNSVNSPAVASEGTIMASDWQMQAVAKPIGSQPVAAEINSQGTIMLDAALASTEVIDDPDSLAGGPRGVQNHKLSSGESAAAIDRLRYLTNLIRSVRGALCPANGIVVLLASHRLNANDDDVNEFTKAINNDLETLSQELQLRCPVSAMVTGMENEPGFQEFIRRVGKDRSVWQRFGKKFEPDTENSRDEMRSFASHVIGAFEDWIYTLFREPESLSKPGNTHLYELLCNVRCTMKSRLEQVLMNAFSSDNHPLLFSGCYFSATGVTADQQGFVRGFMDKLVDEQELLQWTDKALRDDRRIRWASRMGWLAGLIGTVAIVFVFGQRTMGWW